MQPPASTRHLHGSLLGAQLADPASDGLPQQHTQKIGARPDDPDLSRFEDADEDVAAEDINSALATAALAQFSSCKQEGAREGATKSQVPQGPSSHAPAAVPEKPRSSSQTPSNTSSEAEPLENKAAEEPSNVISEDDEKGTTDKMDTAGDEAEVVQGAIDSSPCHDNYSDAVSDAEEEDPSILKGIRKPGEHDVLFGRGGLTNRHPGNVRFRDLLKKHKMRYINAWKADKPKVAREVVAIWRKMEPPGRFLAPTKTEPHLNPARGTKVLVWHDVGNKRAQEKTSQCLREKNSQIKAAEAMANLHNKKVAPPLKPRPFGAEQPQPMGDSKLGRRPAVGNVASPPPPPLPPHELRRVAPVGPPPSSSSSRASPAPAAAAPNPAPLQVPPPTLLGALDPEIRRILDLQDRIKAARSRIESAQGRIEAQAATASLAAALTTGAGAPHAPPPLPGPAALAVQCEALALLRNQQLLEAVRQQQQQQQQHPGLVVQHALAAAFATQRGIVNAASPLASLLVGSAHATAGQSYPDVGGAQRPPPNQPASSAGAVENGAFSAGLP